MEHSYDFNAKPFLRLTAKIIEIWPWNFDLGRAIVVKNFWDSVYARASGRIVVNFFVHNTWAT